MANTGKRGSAAGGLALLAAAGCLCWKGLKTVDRRLRQKTEQKGQKRPPKE